ncbi:uncharacterized protein FPRN_15187 [Fusarium proliferatum]|nr:uncharacterized protein FPRN_15187 [Fusarium proliferatum]
MQLQFTKL